MSSFLVAARFSLRKRVGGGSFGEIYLGEDIESHQPVAIKLEPSSTKSPQLEVESRIYRFLEGGTGVPKCYFYGTEGKYNIMVIDYLSISLEDLLNKRKTFSLKTVMMLADQMISCIEFMHKKHFIHRDIKPDNFMLGLNKASNQVYIIDFGLSRRFEDPKTFKHIAYSDKRSMTGTARYASVNAMRGIEQSRRDDMESLGYVWIYLLKGKLPWQGIPAKTQKEKMEKIATVKSDTSLDNLCHGFPKFFIRYLKEVRNLKFDEEPKYSEYRKMLRDTMINEGILYDYEFDWCSEKKVALTQPVSPTKLSPRENTIPIPPKRINNTMNNNMVNNNVVNNNNINNNVVNININTSQQPAQMMAAATGAAPKLKTNPNLKRYAATNPNFTAINMRSLEKLSHIRTACPSPKGKKQAAQSRGMKPNVLAPIKHHSVFPIIDPK